MSADRIPAEAAASAASEADVTRIAARELCVRPEEVSSARLAGDASSRAFYRVAYPGGSVIAVRYPRPFSAGEPAAARLERWCERVADGRLTFANDPLCHVELTSVLAEHGIPVPAIVAVSGADGLLFVEDAGDELLQAWARDASPEDVEAAYERAVDLIAAIRAATDDVVAAGSVAASLAFDEEKLYWELDFFRANCFERYLGAPLPEGLDAALRAECRALASELAARPRVLCHRDYHARNIIVREGLPVREAVVVIDFQDARMGPVTYDAVSLLEDPYASIPAGRKRRLRERFEAGLRADGRWPGREALDEEYDLMTAQRLLKAVGTYTHQAAARGKREYVPYIAPAVAEARAALGRLARFPALLGALGRIPGGAA